MTETRPKQNLIAATKEYVELQKELDTAISTTNLKEYARLKPLVEEAARRKDALQKEALEG